MSVCFNDTTDCVFSGGLDNDIKVHGIHVSCFHKIIDCSCNCDACILTHQVWDLRQAEFAYKMAGHADSITGLRLSPDGSYLLSNSMDSSGVYQKPNISASYTFDKIVFKGKWWCPY